jgi:hypothetical protein
LKKSVVEISIGVVNIIQNTFYPNDIDIVYNIKRFDDNELEKI